jgi:hypothetical protein
MGSPLPQVVIPQSRQSLGPQMASHPAQNFGVTPV